MNYYARLFSLCIKFVCYDHTVFFLKGNIIINVTAYINDCPFINSEKFQLYMLWYQRETIYRQQSSFWFIINLEADVLTFHVIFGFRKTARKNSDLIVCSSHYQTMTLSMYVIYDVNIFFFSFYFLNVSHNSFLFWFLVHVCSIKKFVQLFHDYHFKEITSQRTESLDGRNVWWRNARLQHLPQRYVTNL